MRSLWLPLFALLMQAAIGGVISLCAECNVRAASAISSRTSSSPRPTLNALPRKPFSLNTCAASHGGVVAADLKTTWPAFLLRAPAASSSRCTLLRFLRSVSGIARLQMSEKRYKEQLKGKKFRTVGSSSVARHYRLQGRGGGLPRLRKATGLPTNPIILPMRRCMLLGKMDNRKARSVSHSGRRTHRIQRVNLAWKRLWWPEGNHYVRLRLSMKGLKTIKKYGLQRAADKFNLNLRDKRLFAGHSHRGKGRLALSENKQLEEMTSGEGAGADALEAVGSAITRSQ
ncbi:hypothetical protein Emag_005957 [Eimeria magna]